MLYINYKKKPLMPDVVNRCEAILTTTFKVNGRAAK